MSEYTDRLRAKIAGADAPTARAAMLNIIRRVARRRLYEYARVNYIVDFSDTAIVEQRHRDFLDSNQSTAASYAGSVQAASSMGELLAVFDSMIDFLE